MKLTQKKKGILLLLFIILLFTFLNLIMDDDSKEGFVIRFGFLIKKEEVVVNWWMNVIGFVRY